MEHRSRSTLVQVMTCCPTTPNHNLNRWYRNWPRYGLLEWFLLPQRHNRSRAGQPHDSPERTSGQFLFYHENEAIHCEKRSDDEPPCWKIGPYDVTIASSSCIDGITIIHPFSFEIVSVTTKNERYGFRLFKVTWSCQIQMSSGILSMVNITRRWTHVRDSRFFRFQHRKPWYVTS